MTILSVGRPISHVSGAIRADAIIGKKVLTMDEYIEREAAIKELMNDALGQVGYSREDAAAGAGGR